MTDAPLILRLDGFEGPMDLLLDLAQRQKVDLQRISILSLVEQYLAIMDAVRLELAADWLVMAAWLAWLKSRLLLPDPADAAPDPEGETAAGVLASRLRDLQVTRSAAAWLDGRAQLGRDVWGRGAPEDFVRWDRSGLRAALPGLLRAYVAARSRTGTYQPGRPALWSVADALDRLAVMLGVRDTWTSLAAFLPPDPRPLQRRAALASTLLAGLELARDGRAELRQDQAFGAIHLRAAVRPVSA